MKKVFTVLMAVFAIALFSAPVGAQVLASPSPQIIETIGDALGHIPVLNSIPRNLSTYGENATVAIGAWEMLTDTGATPTFPTSAAVVSCVSTKAADDAAGTGVRTLTVYGVDSNCHFAYSTINMDGTVASATTSTYLGIARIAAATVGSGGVSAGQISCSIGGNVQLTIPTGRTSSHAAWTIVPSSSDSRFTWSGIIKDWSCSSDGDIKCGLYYRNLSTGITNWYERRDDGQLTGLVNQSYYTPPAAGQCTSIWLAGYAEDATAATIHGWLDVYLRRSIDNY